tara:strand:+ start:6201 stop:7283 length:1083 start_codon:yes stop_codon:yes gene_type:complete
MIEEVKTRNVLLTSAGRRTYLVQYFKDALNGNGKVYSSNSEWSTALEVADQGVISPRIYDEEYIPFLIEYCQQNNISVIIPLFDIDLPVLAKAKHLFKELGISVIVSEFEVTQICNDKWQTYQFLVENGINTPKSFIELAKVETALKEKAINFPLIIKPRWGMGSMSVYKVETEDELRVLYRKVYREIRDSYLQYESQSDYHHTIIIQECLAGQEYCLDVVNDLEKNYITTWTKKKLAERAGESDCAITEKNEALEVLGEKVSIALGHIANLDVDCFLVDEIPYVIELNCRFGGAYPFSHIAGANLPAAILKWLDNKDGKSELAAYKVGIKGHKDITLMQMLEGRAEVLNNILELQIISS